MFPFERFTYLTIGNTGALGLTARSSPHRSSCLLICLPVFVLSSYHPHTHASLGTFT